MGKATLRISFDQQPVSAGSNLTGRILVNVQGGEISASDLVVTLTGTERSEVRYLDRVTQSTGETHHDTEDIARTATGFRSILQMTLPTDRVDMMIQYGGRIAVGNHEVPFQVQLPDSLPSSFRTDLGGGYCEIDYKLKAILKGSGSLWNYNAEETFAVQAKPLETSRVAYQGQPVTESIVSCCCFNKGSVSFGVSVNDTKLDKGETCNVGMAVQNHSSFAIQEAKAVLKESVVWEAQGGAYRKEQRNETELGTYTFHVNPDPLESGGGDSQVFAKIHEQLQAGKHVGQITMPHTAHATYHGALIKIDHEVVVDIRLEGGCCINGSLTHDVPIQCGEPQAPGTPSPPPEGPPTAAGIHVDNKEASLGGKATATEDDLFIPPDATGAPSIETLLQEMSTSLKDADVISSKLGNPDWNPVFASLSPAAYGFLISKVDLDFDQAPVAETVAKHLQATNRDHFTCAHVVAALKSTPEWNRGTMVEKLIVHCGDLKEQQSSITSQLTDWEKVVTEHAFAKALAA